MHDVLSLFPSLRFGLLCLGLGLLSTGALAEEGLFHLFRDGQPQASILVKPEEALADPGDRMSPTEAYQRIPADVPSDLARAIAEFRRDLRTGYGVDLPIGEDPALPNQLELVVEQRPLRDEDRTTLEFPSETVLRITGGESGVRRALFRLLEEFAGVRYLFHSSRDDIGFGAHFPARDSLGIPRAPLNWTSAFPLFRGSPQTTYGAEWAGRFNRAYFWNWEMRLGTKARTAAGHMRVPFPLDEYAERDEKPDEEIFPILNGERYLAWKNPAMSYHWQPRYSHPGTAEEAVRNILAYLRAHPQVTSVSLGVNDSGGHCETERGREVETYYRWVNAVAERVTAEFPEVVLTVLSYREVEPAPRFPLHPNVLAILCFDSHACLDPEVRAKREALVRDWARVARIGQYGYDTGDHVYKLPRIYFGIQREMIRFLHAQGAEHVYSERAYNTASEGPKTYLQYKLLEDPDLDLEATLRDWCRAAVGEQASEPLRAYYDFWETFWKTQAIHTGWWNSRHAQYLSYAGFGSYMYALNPGDIAKCRTLMESVVSLARQHGTPDQQKRAAFLMATFEWNEANATAIGGELIAPDGTLPDRDAALALLRNIPAALAAAGRSHRIPYETTGWLAPGITTGLPEDATDAYVGVVAGSLSLVANFLQDSDVQDGLRSLAADETLSDPIRFLAGTLLRSAAGDDTGNLARDGSFETDAQEWGLDHLVHGRVSHSDTVAFRGTHSLKCEIDHWNFTTKAHISGAIPDTAYFFSARVFIPADQPVAEGRLNIRGSVAYRLDDQLHNRNHTTNIPDIVLKPGQWNYVSCIIPAAAMHPQRGVDALILRLHFKRFERGDVAYVDDVQVYPIQ